MMGNMNAEAVEFEIDRLRKCCAAYRAQLAERNGWIETWFANHNSSATPFAAAIEERDRALAQLAERDKTIEAQAQTIARLEGNNTALRSELEWYGDEGNWEDRPDTFYSHLNKPPKVHVDKGRRARKALKGKDDAE